MRKQRIDVSPGDLLGDQIKAIRDDKIMTQQQKNKALETLEKQIKNLPPGPRKSALRAVLKRAKAAAKYADKFCLILDLLDIVDTLERAESSGKTPTQQYLEDLFGVPIGPQPL